MKKKQLNLTSGPILRTLSELALPIMASSFLSTAYNITDMAWIGMLGSKAVAGVGVGGMYVWLSQGLSSLARMGGQVNMAHSLCTGSSAAYHTILSFCYIDQYIIYESAAAVFCIK